jgi:hypothetical protein
MNRQRIRESPRISVNKLGEYMVAQSSKRRSILADQKIPPTFQVTYYEDAMTAVREFYEMGGRDDQIIVRAIERLEARQGETDYEAQKTNSSAEALGQFLDVIDILDLSAYETGYGERTPAKLVINGVDISVRPDLLLFRDGALVGAVKFAVSKGTPLDREAAEYIATTVHRYVEDVLGADAPDPRDTFVVDVFRTNVLRAPRSFRRRRKDLDAACEEIAARWPSL